MTAPNSESRSPGAPDDDRLQQQVERLHQLRVYSRWVVVGGLWLTVGSVSLWNLRYSMSLVLEYFTWSAVYYGFVLHPSASLGLATCVAFTTTVLLWQSWHILFGMPKGDRKRLEQQVLRIRQQGASHPFWKYVCQDRPSSNH